jgi:sodium/proline symporter
MTTVIFVMTFIVIIAMGYFTSRGVKSLKAFTVASRSVSWWMLLATFTAANVSAGMYLGATNLAGKIGYAAWCFTWPTCAGWLVIFGFSGILMYRFARKYGVLTIPDFFANRFPSQGKGIRAISALIIPLAYVPYMTAQLVAIGGISNAVFGFSYHLSVVVVALVLISFLATGGMTSIVKIDALMIILVIIGLIVPSIVSVPFLGGGDAIAGWQKVLSGKGGDIFKGISKSWPWWVMVGQFAWLFANSTEPHLLTKVLTAKNEREIIKALPCVICINLLLYAAIVPIALVGSLLPQADGGTGGYHYINMVKHLSSVVAGLSLAGVTTAAITTVSVQALNSTTSITRDFYQKVFNPDASDDKVLRLTRGWTIIIVAATAGLALWNPIGIYWLSVLSAALIASAFFVPYILGFIFPRMSGSAAFWSMIVGFAACLCTYIINKALHTHYFIDHVYAGLIFSIITCVVVGIYKKASPGDIEAGLCVRSKELAENAQSDG